MYAGAIAVPLIIGGVPDLPKDQVALLITCDLFACGVVSVVQSVGFWKPGIRLPVMMGVTFASVPTMIVIAGDPSLRARRSRHHHVRDGLRDGINILGKVDFTNRNNLFIVAIGVGVGMIPQVAPGVFDQLPKSLAPLTHSGIALAAVASVVLNLYFNNKSAKPGKPALESSGRAGGS